jgi:hypothetical protein
MNAHAKIASGANIPTYKTVEGLSINASITVQTMKSPQTNSHDFFRFNQRALNP